MKLHTFLFAVLCLVFSNAETFGRVSSPAADAANRFNTIQYAIQQGDVATVRAWLKTPGGINIRMNSGDSPTFLTQATRLGQEEIARLLISSGANVNLPDGHKTSPLMHAVKKGNRRMVALLLNAGAQVNDYNEWSETPLSLAKNSRNSDIVSMLKKAGAMD